MTMPVLPALQQPKGTPGPLTDVLDDMAPEDIQDLVQVAAEWGDAGEPSLVQDLPGTNVETDMDTPQEDDPLPGVDTVQHDESNETLEQEASETPEDQTAEGGAENIEGLLAQVQQCADTAEGYDDKFDELIEQAKAAEEQGADPEAVEELKDDAAEYVQEIADMMDEANKAAKDDDAEGVAVQGLSIKKHCEILDQLYQQAQMHATGHQPPTPAPGSITGKQPALAKWAANYKG